MIDKTQNHIVYYILKMGRMQTSNKSMPSFTRAEILKEVCSHVQA